MHKTDAEFYSTPKGNFQIEVFSASKVLIIKEKKGLSYRSQIVGIQNDFHKKKLKL